MHEGDRELALRISLRHLSVLEKPRSPGGCLFWLFCAATARCVAALRLLGRSWTVFVSNRNVKPLRRSVEAAASPAPHNLFGWRQPRLCPLRLSLLREREGGIEREIERDRDVLHLREDSPVGPDPPPHPPSRLAGAGRRCDVGLGVWWSGPRNPGQAHGPIACPGWSRSSARRKLGEVVRRGAAAQLACDGSHLAGVWKTTRLLRCHCCRISSVSSSDARAGRRPR